MEVGQIWKCHNAEVFPGKKVGPPLEKGKEYPIKGIYIELAYVQGQDGSPDVENRFPHLDLGFVSEYNYITSQDTGEELPGGDSIHWVHPSRGTII